MRQLSVALEYPSWFAVLSYYIPDHYYEKYLPIFRQMGGTFHYTGR